MAYRIVTQRLTTSGAIGSGNKAIRVFWASLVSTSTASTAILKSGGSGGTAYDQIDGTLSKAARVNYAGGMLLPTSGYYTADGNQSYITIGYSEEDV